MVVILAWIGQPSLHIPANTGIISLASADLSIGKSEKISTEI